MEARRSDLAHNVIDHQNHDPKAVAPGKLGESIISDTANRLRAWGAASHDGVQKTLGVSFRDLNVHGSSAKSDYHHTVLDYPLKLAKLIPFLAKRRRSKVEILYRIDGLIKSCELLLVLGRPGSGCSTFLKTLAGRMHGIHLGPQSKLNYQGITNHQTRQQFHGEYIYTAEHDRHFPELTVDQTLYFAAACREPSKEGLKTLAIPSRAIQLKDILMSALDLQGVQDTILGNEMLRGVSGGEMKRVSILEALVGRAPLQCWDNSTRGLDSATTLRFAQTLREVTQVTTASAVVSLYQASQAIYDTFDKVVLLYQGREIFFGRIENAKQYFKELGFHCPQSVTTADFLTAMTHPPEARMLVKKGYESRVPRSSEDFEKIWHNSVERQNLLAQIESVEERNPLHTSNFE